MAKTLSVACVQMTSTPDIQENLEAVSVLIRKAAEQGARFIVTPENTCHMRKSSELKLESTPRQDDHPGVPFFSDLAKELGVTLLIGSMAVRVDGDKLLNRSFVFAPDGSLVDAYDKIHLFEVQLSTGEAHREADVFKAGERAVTIPLENDFTAGLSICYDLRFAYLYRALAKAGANILCVPAAFTVPTGQAHWETLLRARAIETGCYVLAAAQVGEHEGGRKTYGHSMIIAPWGEKIAEIADGVGIVQATLEIEKIEKARGAINALNHDREFKTG